MLIQESQSITTPANDSAPITSISLEHERVTGAFLYSPINLEFISTLCHQIIGHILLTHQTLKKLVSDELLRDVFANKDVGFLRRFGFLSVKIENTSVIIAKFLNQNVIFQYKEIMNEYKIFKESMTKIWTQYSQIETNQHTFKVYHSFTNKRPHDEFETEGFVGAAIVGGIAGGSLLGITIANIF